MNSTVAYKKDLFVGMLFLIAGIYFMLSMATRMITSYEPEEITLTGNIFPSLLVSLFSILLIIFGLKNITNQRKYIVFASIFIYLVYLGLCYV